MLVCQSNLSYLNIVVYTKVELNAQQNKIRDVAELKFYDFSKLTNCFICVYAMVLLLLDN